MITLNKNCENGARYFHFEENGLVIRIYVRLGQGDYSYCNVTTNKQRNRMSLPKSGMVKIVYLMHLSLTKTKHIKEHLELFFVH